jgi:hypothetical protein
MKNLSKVLLSSFALFVSLSVGFWAKIWLEPSGWDLISQCTNNIDIMMDTDWVETNTVGVSFYIDDTVFALNDLDTVGWIFPAYTSFVRGKAWHGDRKWQQTISFMWTTASKDWFKWKWKLATLKVVPLLWVNSFDIEFYAIPEFSADDSNINYSLDWEIFDALKEAIWAKYNVVQWECPIYEAPVIISEDDQIILKTQEKETFFVHQMPFFKRLWVTLAKNVNYIVITLLIALILWFLFKNKKDDKKSKKVSK